MMAKELCSASGLGSIRRRVERLLASGDSRGIINMGMGDPSLPLMSPVVDAIVRATVELGQAATFHRYMPVHGLPSLRKLVAEQEYLAYGISADEVFISSGIKSDIGSLQELFARPIRVCVTDPSYPAFVDASRFHHNDVIYCPLGENCLPTGPPAEPCDLIYLCSPNNPTGVALGERDLKVWVEYAIASEALLVVDNAYHHFVTDPTVPSSIYEIPRAKECAIEMRTYSKVASFSPLRCSYLIVPFAAQASLVHPGCRASLHAAWSLWQERSFYGVAYPVQKGAEALYSTEVAGQIKARMLYHQQSAMHVRECMENWGFRCFGGINSPYLWLATPKGFTSEEFFEHLFREYGLVCVPGTCFGSGGEGFVRLSSLLAPEIFEEALCCLKRIAQDLV